MRLTRYTDYAMRVLLYVGARPERLCSISEVSRAYGISHVEMPATPSRVWRAISEAAAG